MLKIDKIFQVLILEPGGGSAEPSKSLVANTTSFREAYPQADYRLYEAPALRRFIQDRFGDDVTAAYDQLTPFAFKADLARYCLLHEFGGVYSDLSNLHLRPITSSQSPTMVVFRDIPEHPPWAISNALIYAQPGRKEIARAIRLIQRHTRRRFYGSAPLDPTGPYLFGRVLAQTVDWRRIEFGHSRRQSSKWYSPFKKPAVSIEKLLADGSVIAVKQKMRNADIAEFIGTGSNNYSHLWHRRQVYGEPTMVLAASGPLLSPGKGVTRCGDVLDIASGHGGLRIAGAKVPLSAGVHEITLKFEPGNLHGGYRLEMHFDGDIVLLSQIISGTVAHRFQLELSEPVGTAELRLHCDTEFVGRLRRIEISKV